MTFDTINRVSNVKTPTPYSMKYFISIILLLIIYSLVGCTPAVTENCLKKAVRLCEQYNGEGMPCVKTGVTVNKKYHAEAVVLIDGAEYSLDGNDTIIKTTDRFCNLKYCSLAEARELLNEQLKE